MSLTNSDDAGALVTRADAHFSAQRFSEAINGYRNVLALRPRDAHALHRMGLASVHMDRVDQARGYLEQAVQAAPDRSELWKHAGLLAALKHDYAAEALYRRAIALTGSTASLRRNLADCLRLSGRLSEAMTHYKQSAEIEPALRHYITQFAPWHGSARNLERSMTLRTIGNARGCFTRPGCKTDLI